MSLFSVACGDDGDDDGGTETDANETVFPAVPTLGTQSDRMGRPAIATALQARFDDVFKQDQDAALDAYNQDGDVAGWSTAYSGADGGFRSHIAIFDSLDTATLAGDGCGNEGNLLADLELAGGEARYQVFATVLADDRLYVDSGEGSCPDLGYLAVEARFIGLPLDGCGGRTPTMDVIDVSYTALATGLAGGNPLAVGDGIGEDPDGPTDNNTFPFLLAPTP
ncbi:MAG: hypothetical protein AAGC55_02085 [Myxococcota bacterium]